MRGLRDALNVRVPYVICKRNKKNSKTTTKPKQKQMGSNNGREQVTYCEFEAGEKATWPKIKF